jgi:hypothetical protein
MGNWGLIDKDTPLDVYTKVRFIPILLAIWTHGGDFTLSLAGSTARKWSWCSQTSLSKKVVHSILVMTHTGKPMTCTIGGRTTWSGMLTDSYDVRIHLKLLCCQV